MEYLDSEYGIDHITIGDLEDLLIDIQVKVKIILEEQEKERIQHEQENEVQQTAQKPKGMRM